MPLRGVGVHAEGGREFLKAFKDACFGRWGLFEWKTGQGSLPVVDERSPLRPPVLVCLLSDATRGRFVLFLGQVAGGGLRGCVLW